mmetsp:Transcript_24860/g.45018  ORF Transcript_24860/g.45018 Transcript_24860/m.45018 type:complete len:90 (+) Transcript_24860:436-705(+)
MGAATRGRGGGDELYDPPLADRGPVSGEGIRARTSRPFPEALSVWEPGLPTRLLPLAALQAGVCEAVGVGREVAAWCRPARISPESTDS